MLNIAAYHFVSIDRPAELAQTLHERADAAGLRGTILVAGEGINLFLAGRDEAIHGFLDALREDARFADLLVKSSRSRGQPFGRLKTKVKPEIISFRRDNASPLSDGRAPMVEPHTLARWLDQGFDDAGKPVVMLDTRNAFKKIEKSVPVIVVSGAVPSATAGTNRTPSAAACPFVSLSSTYPALPALNVNVPSATH